MYGRYQLNVLYIHNFFRSNMKRDHKEDNEVDLVSRLQTPIRALVQQFSAHKIYSQLLGEHELSPEGELVESTLSPVLVAKDQQPKRLFAKKNQKSDFWSTYIPHTFYFGIRRSYTSDPRINTVIAAQNIPSEETWDRVESTLTEIPDKNIRATLHILKCIRDEKLANICTDPITGKGLKAATRRLFFLTDLGKHTKKRILEATTVKAGLPFSNIRKKITQLNASTKGVRLQINKTISSQAEEDLYKELDKCQTLQHHSTPAFCRS